MKKIISIVVTLSILFALVVPVHSVVATNQEKIELVADAIINMRKSDELYTLLELIRNVDDAEELIDAYSSAFDGLVPGEYADAASIGETSLLLLEALDAYTGSNLEKNMIIDGFTSQIPEGGDFETIIGMTTEQFIQGIERLDKLFTWLSNSLFANRLGENKKVFIVSEDHGTMSVQEDRANTLFDIAALLQNIEPSERDKVIAGLEGLSAYYMNATSEEKVLVYTYLNSYGFVEVESTTGGGTGGSNGSGPGIIIVNPPVVEEVIGDSEAPLGLPNFSDIGHVEWARIAIEQLYGYGIIKGKSDSIYDPDGFITRAEFSALIVRLLELVEEGDTVFEDVQEVDWFYGEVKACANKGYILGVGQNKFDPKSNVTNEQVATILSRILKNSSYKVLESYDYIKLIEGYEDFDNISSWAKEGISMVGEKEIMLGFKNEEKVSFKPKAPATRAEVAVYLYNITKWVETKVTNSDI